VVALNRSKAAKAVPHSAGGGRCDRVPARKERPAEAAARDALLALAYGPARFTKASERLREGRRAELALVAAEGRRIVGTVRLWQVSAGPDRRALLLGPLAGAPPPRRRRLRSPPGRPPPPGTPPPPPPPPPPRSGTRPITRGLASPARRPARCGYLGLTSGTGCLGASSSPARSTAPAA